MRLREGILFGLIFISLVENSASAQVGYEPVKFTVSSFNISGDNPIGANNAQKVLQPYLGEQSGLDGISAAADALEQALITAGFSFHRVSLPPQQLTSGSVDFKIVRFSIGAIKISGNQFFDQQNIERSLPTLKPGSTPNTKALSSSLKQANNHAAKNILLRFKEGEAGDTIDAELTVRDQNPQLFFVTLDNTGSADSEEFRTTLGYQHGNLFNRDHALTATLTVAPEDIDATTQIGLSYHIPLYENGGNLDFLLSDSEVNTGDVASNVAINGKGSVFGASYARPFLPGTNLNHQWSVGSQYKAFDNEIDLGGGLVQNFDVLSFPLELGYGFNYSSKAGVVNGGVKYAMNLDAGDNNTDADYAASRTGADNGWSALRYNLSYDRGFAQNWLFHAGLSGQKSSDLLISGEQFGVGGSSTLRGFEERSVTGDSGNQLSLEVWTPAWYSTRFLVFIDQASVKLNDGPTINDGASFDLSSSGLGLRWAWKQQLSIALDYAVINKGGGVDTTINQDGDDKVHFNLIYRF
ncbi:MAG: ShlB/FhaC/HecB family hemolysin secretion/activation protein [Gammaproteobacteria bacterium]|nr:ShlB/FhaC/HecB family hemolysin secretion/activation protein [Gammaproteobacteria bacterium]